MLARTSHAAAQALLGLVILALLVAGVAAWRLSRGPVSVAFLTPYVEQALSSPGIEYRVRVEDTVLTWAGWQRAVDLRATNVKLINRAGEMVAAVPELAVSFSVSALLRARLAPTSVELVNPRLAVTRGADGSVRVGAVGEPGAGDALDEWIAAVTAPDAAQHGARPVLTRFAVVGGTLTVDDKIADVLWRVPHIDVVLRWQAQGMAGQASIDVDTGGQPTRIDLNGRHDTASGRTRLVAEWSGLVPAMAARTHPALAPLAAAELPTAGRADVVIEGGTIVSATARFTGGEGKLREPAPWPDGLAVSDVKGEIVYDSAARRVRVTTLQADVAGSAFSATGEARMEGDDSGRFVVDAVLDAVPMDRLPVLWAEGLAPNPRQWLTKNLTGGQAGDLKVSAEGRFGPSGLTIDTIDGSLEGNGLTVHYLRPLPPVSGVAGRVTFDMDAVTVVPRAGHLGALSVTGGRIDFTGLSGEDHRASIKLDIGGPLAEALALLDHPRFGYASAIGVAPGAVSGTVQSTLELSFPLLDALRFDQMKIAATAELADVAVDASAFGFPVTEGRFALDLDLDGMDLKGEARITGALAEVAWHENFKKNAAEQRRLKLNAVFGDAEIAALDLGIDGLLAGPVGVGLDLGQPRKDVWRGSVRLGLDQASLAVPALGWSKAAGEPGAARAVVTLTEGRLTELRDIVVEAEGLQARGAVRLRAADGWPEDIRVSDVAVGRSRFSAQAIRRADGGYDIEIGGGALDLSHLNDGNDDRGVERWPAVDLSARVEQLWLGDAGPVSGATASLRYDGEAMRALAFEGVPSGGKPVVARLTEIGERRRFSLETKDAGAALKAADLFAAANGGTLSIQAEKPDRTAATPWTGTLSMHEFTLQDAPILARLLTLASLSGIVDLMSGRGVSFARAAAEFSLNNHVLTLREARAVGSELGITAEGTIDIGNNALGVDGTIIPAYTINSILGNIPLLGPLISGGKGQGVFAASYAIRGPVADPVVTVNPLSVLAPGFLRGLIDGLFMPAPAPVPGPAVPAVPANPAPQPVTPG